MNNKPKLYLSIFLATFFIVIYMPLFVSGETYKWHDDEGVLHFTDNIFNVPPRYRSQVETKIDNDVQRYSAPDPVDDKPSPESEEKISGDDRKEIRVPYIPHEGYASRIIIPVKFHGSVTANLLLDTGAPGMVITPELADRIGIFEKDDGKLIHEAGGIGGSVPAILTIVDKVSVGEATTYFLPTTITEMFSDAYEGLVGMDFMANYDLQVDSQSKTIILREIPASEDRPAGRDEHWWRSKYRIFAGLKRAWESYYNRLKVLTITTLEVQQIRKIARRQVKESEKLYKRLDRYATQNGVPRQWRE